MVTSPPAWLGLPESDTLEYKSADALRHPEIITRAVVALLNNRGGSVVCGVDATGNVQGITDCLKQCERLQSTIIERVRPRPLTKVRVECVPMSAGKSVLIVTAEASDGGPYAELHAGRMGFWIRSGSTTRALEYDEVRNRLVPGDTAPSRVRWDAGLEGRPGPVLVLRAQPLEAVRWSKAVLESVFDLNNRMRINGRPNGWSVIAQRAGSPKPGKRFEVGGREQRRWLSVDRVQGTIRFEGSADFLRWKKPRFIQEEVIYPFPLVEGAASFCRLVSTMGSEAALEGDLFCEIGIWKPQGWRLGPGYPGSVPWEFDAGSWTAPYSEINPQDEHRVRWRELIEAPDETAYRLVRGTYEWFGYSEAEIPFWSAARRQFVFE
jgi:hypothetical protein